MRSRRAARRTQGWFGNGRCQLFGLHHVNETVSRELWLTWDLRFLAWGVLMLVVGRALVSAARGRAAPRSDPAAAAAATRARAPQRR